MERDTCFENFCRGEVGNRPLQFFEPEHFHLKNAYEILIQKHEQSPEKARASQFLCLAINEAIRTAEIVLGQGRLAILVGTGLRELRSLELWWADGQALQVGELHFGGAVQRTTELRCPIMTFSNACSASSFALGLAEDMLALGEVDTVIVAGCDSITETMFGLADRVSPLRPEQVQPFDRDRRGALLGEGAAAVVLESAEQASNRGVNCRAWLRGVGMSCDACSDTAPDLGGIVRAIVNAHQRADISPDNVDLLVAHGTGTNLNDKTEATAITEVFGEKANSLMITALKSLIGHTSGASALIGVVTAIECLCQGRIPPTRGFKKPAKEAEKLNIIVDKEKFASLQIAQVNAFGFGGVNAVAILEKSIG
jgi:3-oxoacyl-[acyl-carrier-protein] synthase II